MVQRKDSLGMLTKMMVMILAALFVLPLGTLGASDQGVVTLLGTGSRAGTNVTITGTIYDGAKHPPASAFVLALNATNMGLVNYSITFDGNYSIGLVKNQKVLLYMVPFSGQTLEGYALHGFFPIARFVDVAAVDLYSNFTITPAYELVLKGTDPSGKLVTSENFTNTRWSTMLDDSNAFAVWADVDNGLGTKLPSVLIPINEKRDLYFQWALNGVGYAVVHIDNNTTGYKGLAQGAKMVDVNADLAFSVQYRTVNHLNEYTSRGYSLSSTTTDHQINATAACENSMTATGAARVSELNTCASEYTLAAESAELDRAQSDIEKNRKGDLGLTVVDSKGVPIQGANITYNETSHDFLFGVFDTMTEAGLGAFQQCHDIGINYATVGFYWSQTEPTEGNIQYQTINNTWGIKALTDMGYTVHAHALIYLNDLVTPAYLKTKDFNAFNKSVYSHVYNLVNVYKDKIHIWNLVNEANSQWAMAGFNRTEITQIIRTGAKAIKDADPQGRVLVNNPNDWFGQSSSLGYLIDNYDNQTLSIQSYIDLLELDGIPIDILGQQMYDGGYSSFFLEAGVGPGMPVPTFDLSFDSYMFDQLSEYNKSIAMSELSVSGMWNDTWKDAGYWHNKWNLSVQAEFLRQFYTIAFSKEKMESLTWWDLDDNTSFLDGGGLFDDHMKPKPVFYTMKDLIAGWTTNGNASTDEFGQAAIKGFGGDYTITVNWKNYTRTISPHITERTSQNLVINFTEDYQKPDLVLHKYDTLVRTDQFLSTGNVLISSIVWNEGAANATNVTVRLLLEDPVNGTVVFDREVPLLTPGNYETLDITWYAKDLYGNQTLYLEVDPLHNITESNESNNQLTLLAPLPNPDWGYLKTSVVDDATGLPVSGASLQVLRLNGTLYAENVTGADGNFTFNKVPGSCYKVLAQKELFLPANASGCVMSLQTKVLKIRLIAITTGSVTGVVLDNKTHIGISSATVTLVELNLTTMTNVGGGYSFMELEKGTYNLTVSAPGYTAKTRQFTIYANQTVSADFQLIKNVGILQGTITDASSGKPIRNATVQLGTVQGQITDTDGVYIFIDVPAGSYNMYVGAEGYEGRSVSLFVNTLMITWVNVSLTPIPVQPDLNGTISGYVINSKNLTPIMRAIVTLGTTGRDVLTDDKGFYKFDKVTPGTYDIGVTAKDYKNQTKRTTVTARANMTVNFNLDKIKTKNNNGNLNVTILIVAIVAILLLIVLFVLYTRLRKSSKKATGGKKASVIGKTTDEEE
jgi:GH35 family endo-1,4-beta-xylanase